MIKSIENLDDHCSFDVESPRVYLPFAITAMCPYCATEVTRDLTGDPLRYPHVGGFMEIFFHHSNGTGKPSSHEWTENVMVGFTMTGFP